ncbi:4Fe-4S binding domain-containing protein [Desulfacinum hydrothermale DSM 13146]|uniref:4Fe-4S binding domain-containing protein n=2 Tax=Desulfacinum hydrothermale TaxID=109258 RepID=A0A1W1XUY1_9BACT|nr:4Fe-4S binding domain-containing protein [Desulfacinum hydrothermale DSM 13146]
MKAIRKIIQIDEERCDGCGQCVLACAEGAIEIIDGKAKLVSEVYCDGLGACIGECPQDALHIIEREAEEFDPEAVEAFLESRKQDSGTSPVVSFPQASGCPSTQVHVFSRPDAPAAQAPQGKAASALSHWPVQIRLVPPNAPFLNNAHLLVAGDCVPVAYPSFHQEFLQGRTAMIGCPKFDNPKEYVDKFAEIFERNRLQSVTVVSMEVPCCSALLNIVVKAMEKAQARIPLEEVVVSTRGDILERRTVAA